MLNRNWSAERFYVIKKIQLEKWIKIKPNIAKTTLNQKSFKILNKKLQDKKERLNQINTKYHKVRLGTAYK